MSTLFEQRISSRGVQVELVTGAKELSKRLVVEGFGRLECFLLFGFGLGWFGMANGICT